MANTKYEKYAEEFIDAIRTLAEKPENMDNLESYLSDHFQTWLDRVANTPEGITEEMKHFAEMEM